MKAKNRHVTDYWYAFYVDQLCTLCGNRGVIDSRGLKNRAGVPVGRLNYCICPNGQAMRDAGVDLNERTGPVDLWTAGVIHGLRRAADIIATHKA